MRKIRPRRIGNGFLQEHIEVSGGSAFAGQPACLGGERGQVGVAQSLCRKFSPLPRSGVPEWTKRELVCHNAIVESQQFEPVWLP